MQRISITIKLTLLCAVLSTAPVLYLTFQNSTREVQELSRHRMRACQQLALNCARNLQRRNFDAIRTDLSDFSQQTNDVEGVRLTRFDGLLIHDSSGGELNWAGGMELPNRQLQIPIIRESKNWGYLEARFKTSIGADQAWTLGRAFGFALLFNLMTIGLLLHRSLSVLDTSKTVPRRVRNTLDTIVGGVVILDPKGRVMMANDAFLEYTHQSREQLVGSTLDSLPFQVRDGATPWSIALHQGERRSGVYTELQAKHGETKTFVVNASPIIGSKSELAGALVSFDDVTTLETQKQSLIAAMAELQSSKEQIQQQNRRLQELASKDALTGCFNRRMLMEHLESKWIDYLRLQKSVNVVMLDVDHFKKLNDNFGHAVGDEVLKDVARVLRESVGDSGFVGRYGGEEFCIILSDMPSQEALEVAEGVRRAIQHQLAEPYHVTASFGVSSTEACTECGVANCHTMMERADHALYASKQGGRNQVRLWASEMSGEAVHTSSDKPVPTSSVVQQSVSYQAVTALHSALAYRDADTALHSQRVSEMCVALGRGHMSISELYLLEIAGLLHDIGKIGVPDQVLLKPGKLDKEQWMVMEAHARMGVEIVDSTFQCRELSDIVRYHHYRFDGAGTPPGEPMGQDIPVGARIVSIVDAYDAMVSNRVYRKGRSPDEAFQELRRCAGSQFDPDLVERFVNMRIGWRPDSRYLLNDVEDHLAISVGHLTERTVLAFEAHDVKTLAESLDRLKDVAKQLENVPIIRLTEELSKSIAGRDVDWELVVPTLQNLLDMCLTIQRAHIRDVAARPQATLNCPQQGYYQVARDWDTEAMVTSDSNP